MVIDSFNIDHEREIVSFFITNKEADIGLIYIDIKKKVSSSIEDLGMDDIMRDLDLDDNDVVLEDGRVIHVNFEVNVI